MKKGSIFKFFSRAQPASEAGAAGGGGPEPGAAGDGGSGDATGSTISEDPAAAADVDDAPPEEGEGSAKKQKFTANGYSSAIFHHLQHNQGHSFKLESTDVLDRETRWWERGVKEAIYERMYNPTLNREGGLRVDLSGTWDLALPAPRTDNT
ncbi:hypothetical protein Bbelb_018860 [Branchiostoma belcheri]|nr:hypothetical protein Bbelb_018860 [Branchiostoma belcheri]